MARTIPIDDAPMLGCEGRSCDRGADDRSVIVLDAETLEVLARESYADREVRSAVGALPPKSGGETRGK